MNDPKGYGRKEKPQGREGVNRPGKFGIAGTSGLRGAAGTAIALVLALFLSGCVTSKIVQKVDEIVLSRVDKDLEVTVALAEKYGKEDLAKCAIYLRGALAGKRELLKEETGGIISAVLKIKLLREFALKDEESFKAECGAFAADLLLEITRAIGDGKTGISPIR